MYYEEHINKYFPFIEPYIKEDEQIRFKFYGVFNPTGWGENWNLNGAFVITNKSIYFRGKGGAMSSYKGLAKAKHVQIIPLNAIQLLIDKRKKIVLRYNLELEGAPTKTRNLHIGIKPGKGEPKQDFLKRVHDIFEFIKENSNV
ncbi:MAG: hypothetical protein ACTSPY_06365 [Candidatus Helarchaeota archaeon]